MCHLTRRARRSGCDVSDRPKAALVAPPATLVQYGYVRSLVRSGNGYRMRFDPALWLSGQTANRAAIEDGVIARGETVPNDYYIRNESRRQLSYTVLPRARVTIVTNSAVGGLRATRISVSELAAIVAGRNPKRRAALRTRPRILDPGRG